MNTNRKREVKLSLFSSHKILYVKDPRNASRKLLDLIKLSIVTEYKTSSFPDVSVHPSLGDSLLPGGHHKDAQLSVGMQWA